MVEIQVLERPRMSPMTCVVTGDARGPLLDLGRDIRHYGRVYVKVAALTQALKGIGWLPPDEAEQLRERNQVLEEKAAKLSDVSRKHDQLVATLSEAVIDHLDVPEPEPVTKRVEVPREPNEEEIEEFLMRNPGHPAIKRRQPPEKGSAEEYQRLYGDPRATRRQQHVARMRRSRAEATEKKQAQDPQLEQEHGKGDERVTTELHGQEVNIDELLTHTVKDVVSFCEGKPEEFREEVVNREVELAEQKGTTPRKGVIVGLGFVWEEEESGSDDKESDQ